MIPSPQALATASVLVSGRWPEFQFLIGTIKPPKCRDVTTLTEYQLTNPD